MAAPLAPIPESYNRLLEFLSPSPHQPFNCSIQTVERAAAARFFLESRYNQLFSEQNSPRRVSSNLRQIRALRSGCAKRTDKVSAANFQKVRVLGKGSYGVVTLVNEKSQPVHSAQYSQHDSGRDGHSSNFPGSDVDLNYLAKEIFAMKTIRKSKNILNGQEAHLRAERDFLVLSAHSDWVVTLVASFQDYSNLYLVMEYMVGGDFLGLLLREDVLPESVARFYIAEMIICAEEVHKMNWIHRDIKPDNFLISASGHIKISDFGLAFDGHWSHQQQYYNKTRETLCEKLGIEVRGDAQDIENDLQAVNAQKITNCVTTGTSSGSNLRTDGQLVLDRLNKENMRRLARSVVGTSQYMAVEIIRGEQYDGRCDWWSIGIILYEVYSLSVLNLSGPNSSNFRLCTGQRHSKAKREKAPRRES
jgi:protein-serine/threonine kinase